MKKFATSLIAATAILALAGPLQAAGEYDKKSDTAMETPANIMTAEDLRGMEVVGTDGDSIGEIKNVRIDEETGNVNFVTLSRDDAAGMGEEIAVPLAALRFEEDHATLTVDRSRLENVPEQANLSDEEFGRDLQTHYGVSGPWQEDEVPKESISVEELDEVPNQINRDQQIFTDQRKINTQN